MIDFWLGIGLGIEIIKRRNGDVETYLLLPFIRIRISSRSRQ